MIVDDRVTAEVLRLQEQLADAGLHRLDLGRQCTRGRCGWAPTLPAPLLDWDPLVVSFSAYMQERYEPA